MYIHGFDLQNFLPCNNLLVGRKLNSRDVFSLDPGIGPTHQSVREMPIDQIRTCKFGGVLNPSLCYFLQDRENEIRKIAVNHSSPRLKKTEVELRFEKVRREIADEAASRLNCLYLMKKSSSSEARLRKMFPKRNLFLIDVKISVNWRTSKVDPKWFEMYFDTQDDEYIKKYWKGLPASEEDEWETLVEGEIQMTNRDQFEELKIKALDLHGKEFSKIWDKLAKWDK